MENGVHFFLVCVVSQLGKCYISPILDMDTNEIISYNLSASPNNAIAEYIDYYNNSRIQAKTKTNSFCKQSSIIPQMRCTVSCDKTLFSRFI